MLKLLSAFTMVASIGQAAELNPMTYQQAQEKLADVPKNIAQVLVKTPKIYEFKNSENKNTVFYLGQTFRQILMDDLKPTFLAFERASYSGNSAEAFKALNSFYVYETGAIQTNDDMINGESEIKVTAKAKGGLGLTIAEGDFYVDIFAAGTHLKKKMAGIDNKLRHSELKGWRLKSYGGVFFDKDKDGKLTPDELIEGLTQVQANNMAVVAESKELKVSNGSQGQQIITKASVTESGWELANLIQKILHSAVSFSQAAGDYLSVDLASGKGLTADNKDYFLAGDGTLRPFTILQHHWDEAYGYFGATRNYLDYSDQQLKDKISLDSFIWNEEDNTHMYVQAGQEGDELASLQSEKNFGFAINAGKRDLGAKDPNQKIDMSSEIALAFLRGRHLIQEKPEGYLEYAQAYSVIALTEWEKMIAATVIHYINETLKDFGKYGTEEYSFSNFAKHFSEMKGFALAFQFNPSSLMTIDDFIKMHDWLGDAPVLPQTSNVESYKKDLEKARDLLRDTYKFSKINAEEW